MAIVNDITDEILAAVGEISKNNSYNTSNVTTRKGLVPTSKINTEDGRAYFGVRWIEREAGHRGNSAEAVATYLGYAVMRDTGDEEFADFLEDIEAALTQRNIYQQVDNTYYGGLLFTVAGIRVVDVEEAISDRTHEAELTITASYQYTPEQLSGPPYSLTAPVVSGKP